MRQMIRGMFGLVIATTLVVAGCTEQDNPMGLTPGERGGVSFNEVFATTTTSATTTPTDTVPALGLTTVADAVVRMLPREVPLAASIQVTKLIGVEGGKIEIPEAGLKIHFPNGALTQATQITVTALAGSAVAYDFEPHGLVFQKPLIAVQAFKLTGLTLPLIQGGYFPDNSYLDVANLSARVKERMASEVVVLEKKIKFNIPHFSGYLLSID